MDATQNTIHLHVKGVGNDEQDRSDVDNEDDTQSWYLHTPLDMTEVDCLVPVQGYPHQAQAGDVDTRALKMI